MDGLASGLWRRDPPSRWAALAKGLLRNTLRPCGRCGTPSTSRWTGVAIIAIPPEEELHRHAVENLAQADALLFGRATYEMMEEAFQPMARTGSEPEWMGPFARMIDAARKYVVSSTLDGVDWNAELVRGGLCGSPPRFLGRAAPRWA